MRTPEATLIEPTEELWPEFLAMAEEYSLAGDPRYQPALEDFPAYLRSLLDGARGIGLWALTQYDLRYISIKVLMAIKHFRRLYFEDS
jgi:hypothetical protein